MNDDQEKIVSALMLTYLSETQDGKALRSAVVQAFIRGCNWHRDLIEKEAAPVKPHRDVRLPREGA